MKTYLDTFEAGVRDFPDRPLIVSGEETWTYAEMDELVSRIAWGLIAAGVTPGSHVAVYSPNHAYGFACQWGILRAGCVWVPINSRGGGAAMAAAVDNLDVDWVFFHSSLAADLALISTEIKGAVAVDHPAVGRPSMDEWLPPEMGPPIEFPKRTSDDTAALLLTSGTTGNPKGIVMSNRAYVAAQRGWDSHVKYDAPPRHLVVAPITHAAGMYTEFLHRHGGTHYLLNTTSPRDILAAIEEYRATTLLLPPTLIYMLLADPEVRSFNYSRSGTSSTARRRCRQARCARPGTSSAPS